MKIIGLTILVTSLANIYHHHKSFFIYPFIISQKFLVLSYFFLFTLIIYFVERNFLRIRLITSGKRAPGFFRKLSKLLLMTLKSIIKWSKINSDESFYLPSTNKSKNYSHVTFNVFIKVVYSLITFLIYYWKKNTTWKFSKFSIEYFYLFHKSLYKFFFYL